MKPLLAAAGDDCHAKQASQVCAVCKARKKKCDKTLPSCRNCVRKHLRCVYDYKTPASDRVSPSPHRRGKADSLVTAQVISLEPTSSTITEANIYLEVLRVIRTTGKFVDDISARYFHGLHRHLPIVCRARFHSSLLAARETPSAGFSVLLLAICLVASPPEPESCPGRGAAAANSLAPAEIDRQSLYLTARSFLAQVQALFPPSICAIQAGILLSLYEYAHGHPDKAFTSLASSARTAYTAGIASTSMSAASEDADADVLLQRAEEANTWWGLVICERIFCCDVTVSEQPLITALPDEDSPVPTEPDILEHSHILSLRSNPHVPVSNLTADSIGGFGRTAQAAWLVGRVIKAFDISSWEARVKQLDELDGDLQAFLAMLIHPGYTGKGPVCETIATAIRALFTLHSHIISQYAQTAGVAQERRHRSLATLDTVARMVLDIVESDNINSFSFDCIGPSYTYIVRAAIRHLSGRAEEKDGSWLRTVEERLRRALDQFNRRWKLTPSQVV